MIFEFDKVVKIDLLHGHHVERKSISLRVFKTAGGRWAYSNYANCRHGNYIYWLPLENLVSISDDEYNWEEEAKKLKNKFHDNLWDNLKEKLDGEYLKKDMYGNTSCMSIINKFPKSVIDALKEAIDEKKDYSHKMYGDKRDLSVSVKMCEDGILRAWYSSEFHGCGNGDYWILANPTTAIFKERD